MIFHTIDFDLSDDDKQYIRDTYLTDRFARKNQKEESQYYTGYHHSPTSQNRTGKSIQKFLDTRLLQIYSPVIKKELEEQRLFEADSTATRPCWYTK